MKDDNLDFGQKIAIIAKEKYGNQKKLADELNLQPSNISEWISGKRKPSLDWLILGKTLEAEIDHHEFARIVMYTYDWAKQNNIKPVDDLMVSVYLTFMNNRKENPSLKIQSFLSSMVEVYKNVKFNED